MTENKKLTLNQLLLDTANYIIDLQKSDGSFPAGHNGPHNDPETPVRNTAHFLFLFAHLFQVTGNINYKKAGEKAISYLLGNKARQNFTFYCRDKLGKDHCNGLIGQAWVIEALIKASEAFNRDDCYKLAEKVFLLHPWNERIGVWKCIEVDGTERPVDGTFNHQLWFAAIGSLLNKTTEAKKMTEIFLKKVVPNVYLYSNGVILHSSPVGRLVDFVKSGYFPLVNELKHRHCIKMKLKESYSHSVGYHGFNLYAFAMFKKQYPNNKFWSSFKFKKMTNCVYSTNFQQELLDSEFGYFYNVSGIEIAYAMETFHKNKNETTTWLNWQFKETYLDSKNPLCRNSPDKNTAMARIYQAARLINDYEIIVP